MELNYQPNKKYGVTIEKPSPNHKCFYIYEGGEPDPIINKRFKTHTDAYNFCKKYFPDFNITTKLL